MGMLDRAFIFGFLTKVMLNVALIAGSSKLGIAFRASVGANIVVANHLFMLKGYGDLFRS